MRGSERRRLRSEAGRLRAAAAAERDALRDAAEAAEQAANLVHTDAASFDADQRLGRCWSTRPGM